MVIRVNSSDDVDCVFTLLFNTDVNTKFQCNYGIRKKDVEEISRDKILKNV